MAEEPIAPVVKKTRKKHSPEFLAIRRKARGQMTTAEHHQKYYRLKREATALRRAKKAPWKPKEPPHKRLHAMSRDPITEFWRVRVMTTTGRVEWVSTGEKDEKTALQVVDASGVQKLSIMARARCLTADAASVIIAAHNITCMDVKEAWLKDLNLDMAKNSCSTYESAVDGLFRKYSCLLKPLASITREQLYSFINEPNTKASTREVRLAAVNSLWRHATAYGHVIGNIATTIRINLGSMTIEQRQKEPAAPITEAEYLAVMAHELVPKFWRWATALGWWLGLRMSDVASMELASLGDDFVVLYPRKTGRQLVIPLHEPVIGSGELKSVFQEIRAAAIDPIYCFPERRGLNISKEYVQVLNSIGIMGKSFHGLRHAFRLRLSQSGKPIEEISRLMGHSKLKTTLDYGRGVGFTAPSSSPLPAAASAPGSEEPPLASAG